ncbi:hypothetical protein [Sphingomonas mollis]|uniref:Uncharacterized protein n=1 Tax=Sphingomonas mollis TaxID=2795726 RepID=A0ABS0XSR2_9SPHN|nr:hypothetical protein [Sphingomonas sp. BT553]MBJ6123081.1 hypothetical protein [Sphingomonas sp. BT553]
MGFQISWLAARAPKATLLEALHLTDTGVPDEANEAPFSVAELSGGWSLIWSNDVEWALPSRVPVLVTQTAVVAFMVFEGIDASFVDYAGPDGNWSVSYGLEDGGALHGEWPPALAPVAAAASGPFDVPGDLARALTGYAYNRADDGIRFTIAEIESASGAASEPVAVAAE